jgi:hypothetical protein
MRKAALLFAILITIFGCKKEESPKTSGIIIKGRITDGKTDGASSLMDAKKVMLLNKRQMTLFDIYDNSFSLSAEYGTGIALIFLDADNKYIGNLSSKGLNLLPLGNLSNGESTVIDLSSLRLEGTNVIPSHDPLGNEIIITEEEISSLKAVGEFYESLAKNLDTDNDGVLDILVEKHLMVSTTFGFANCGKWGHNDTVPIVNNISNIFVNYQIDINGGRNHTFSSISLSGPAHDPYSDIETNGQIDPYNGGFSAGSRRPSTDIPPGFPSGQILLPFKKGTYTLALDGNNYSIDYANIDAFNNLVMIIPTIITNNENKITSVSLDYRFVGGAIVNNPSNIVTNIFCQIVGSAGTLDVYHGSSPGGPDSRLSANTGLSSIIPNNPLNLPGSVNMVSIWYEDLLGNGYAIMFNGE